jgi:alanine racemase
MKNFWCEVYLEILHDNVKRIRQNTDKKIMAVIKGNAYGLGIERISGFLDNLVDCFAVTYLDEALKVNSNKDVLIMTPDYKNEDLGKVKSNFILTIDDIHSVQKLAGTGRQYRGHIYINTGMNRFGIYPDRLGGFMDEIHAVSKDIHIEGIYTHLHNTGSKKYSLNQIELFRSCLEKCANGSYNIHLLNSTGFVKYSSECGFDNMVRVGGMLFGFEAVDQGYEKVYQFKATPINTYKIEKGKSVGYGNYYKAKKNTLVGVLDFGYIDKFYCPETIFDSKILGLMGRMYYRRQYKNSITCGGNPVKILGSVNMNYTLIDMEGLPENPVLDVEISSLAADSSVPRKYLPAFMI